MYLTYYGRIKPGASDLLVIHSHLFYDHRNLSTAKAEEEILIEQFGEEYIEYQREVGMFFPKLH